MKWRGMAEEIGFCVREKIVEDQLNAALIGTSAISLNISSPGLNGR
jgi:hypothetical protein